MKKLKQFLFFGKIAEKIFRKFNLYLIDGNILNPKGEHIFYAKFFLRQNFFTPTFFYAKIFLRRIFLRQKTYFTPKSFFYAKKIFCAIFLA